MFDGAWDAAHVKRLACRNSRFFDAAATQVPNDKKQLRWRRQAKNTY